MTEITATVVLPSKQHQENTRIHTRAHTRAHARCCFPPKQTPNADEPSRSGRGCSRGSVLIHDALWRAVIMSWPRRPNVAFEHGRFTRALCAFPGSRRAPGGDLRPGGSVPEQHGHLGALPGAQAAGPRLLRPSPAGSAPQHRCGAKGQPPPPPAPRSSSPPSRLRQVRPWR